MRNNNKPANVAHLAAKIRELAHVIIYVVGATDLFFSSLRDESHRIKLGDFKRAVGTIAYRARNAICDRIEGLIREIRRFSRVHNFHLFRPRQRLESRSIAKSIRDLPLLESIRIDVAVKYLLARRTASMLI